MLLSWDDKVVKALTGTRSWSTFAVNATGWSRGLEVSGGGAGVVSHAGLVLLRHLADKTGLTSGLSRALASPRILVHDRGRVLADLACSIADGARVLGDFRVMGDQRGAVRAGRVGADGVADASGDRPGREGAETRVTAAVSTARRRAWAQVTAPHGALPGVRLADKVLEGVTCIRLDATVVSAHSPASWRRNSLRRISRGSVC
jgi:hypothetical protein